MSDSQNIDSQVVGTASMFGFTVIPAQRRLMNEAVAIDDTDRFWPGSSAI